jgi:hypothetical protein
MAKEKFYPEETLVEKVQSGEFSWLDYINHHSREWKTEYEEYCKGRGLRIDSDSAEQFLDYKEAQLEQALENGDA